jgi:hypothetical protein
MRYGDCIEYGMCKCLDEALGTFALPVSVYFQDRCRSI